MVEFIQIPLGPENWKPIPGYEKLYEISDSGRVKRLPGTPKCKTERILNPSYGKTGYRFIRLWKNGKEERCYIHRLVLLAFLSPPPPDHEVNHKNGVKDDNRLENLEYVTHSENEIHRYRVLGKPARHGEDHHSAKLTEEKVREIRSMIGKVGARPLGRKYGVDNRVIRDIWSEKIWKHVK